MVRAGVVNHPSEWDCCGFKEIRNPKQRYRLINIDCLLELFNISSLEELKKSYSNWINETIENDRNFRDKKWTQAVAVGSLNFVEQTKNKLGIRVKGRNIIRTDVDCFQIKEEIALYNTEFDYENDLLNDENTYFWNSIDKF